MTSREIELLTIAKLEHGGHQLSPAELRELKRLLAEGPVIARRYREMMIGPAYRCNKPSPLRAKRLATSQHQTSPVLVDFIHTTPIHSDYSSVCWFTASLCWFKTVWCWFTFLKNIQIKQRPLNFEATEPTEPTLPVCIIDKFVDVNFSTACSHLVANVKSGQILSVVAAYPT